MTITATAGGTAVAQPRRRYSFRRYYDPPTGQFVSIDPLVDQTEQPYEYVGGDPVDLVDPTGLKFCIGYWCPRDSLEFAKGEVVGAAKFVAATGEAVVHPIAFAQGLASTCSSAYASEGGGFDGGLNCINSLNPFSGFVSAFQAACPEQAGEDVGGSLAATFAIRAAGADAPSLDVTWRVRGRGFHLHFDQTPHRHLGPHLQLDTWRRGFERSGRSFYIGWGWPPWDISRE